MSDVNDWLIHKPEQISEVSQEVVVDYWTEEKLSIHRKALESLKNNPEYQKIINRPVIRPE